MVDAATASTNATNSARTSAARRSRLKLRAANRQLISLIAFPAVGWGWLERDELAVGQAQAAVAAAR